MPAASDPINSWVARSRASKAGLFAVSRISAGQRLLSAGAVAAAGQVHGGAFREVVASVSPENATRR